MPIYEFHCKNCGLDFEELLSSHNSESVRCPECESDEVERKISLFGFSSGGKMETGQYSGGASSCSSCRRTSCAGCK
ncbi:TPA: zinc ribbon domain-containing protein [Candidatus Poribacteria bacterium]|nr:zinc ribbon domain-containing protein [Candidatus Poribacteria bacterium]